MGRELGEEVLPLAGRRCDVGEPARGLAQPVVVSPAARAALEVDRGAREDNSRILARELEVDIRVENCLAGGAASVSLLDAKQLVQVNAWRATFPEASKITNL